MSMQVSQPLGLPMQGKLHSLPFLSVIQPGAVYPLRPLSACWVHISELLLVDFEEFSFSSSPAHSLLPPIPMQHMCMNRRLHSSTACCNAWVDKRTSESLKCCQLHTYFQKRVKEICITNLLNRVY